MLNRARMLRPLVLAAGCTFLLIGLAACVPSRPNSQPLALGIEDGNAVFYWCGEPTEQLGFLAIEYRVFPDDSSVRTAAEGSGSFVLRPGSIFSSTQPPGSLEYIVSEPIPISSRRTLVFVESGFSPENLGAVTVQFDSTELDSLAGRWVHPSGEITAKPCDG